ncbi:Protein ABHD13 [Colletotrichum truncatum]|uniref:Protein ABHD13 n=1 Tax=Colletotrichum truncatum TaxID=5467 RepID=A0ACC3YTK1_COLTU|nr:Protein ABHD13 [Colletotrichum truncatum]KAF6798388.1 Protein ABHD13 [Colletotrichum truncatum]
MHAIRASSIGQLLRRPRRMRTLPVASIWRATSTPMPLLPLLGVTTHKRQLHAEALLLPPLYFCGLLIALWTWKCFMMVVFQNKIIYMPGLPPNARRERIEDYAKQCWGVQWEEKRVRAADGKDLALCVASVESTGVEKATSDQVLTIPSIYILYFQGNASSLPPRLPDLSWVLKTLQRTKRPARYTMVCLSYRGYWTSRGRPSEKGINLDAQAAQRWIEEAHEDEVRHRQQQCQPLPAPGLVIWGQSIGAGVATNLAAYEGFLPKVPLKWLILETPFTSIKAMIEVLYPQKWVPYRHLWPFLRNHLDSLANITAIAKKHPGGSDHEKPRVTIVEAGRDELVPAEHGAKLVQRCEEVGLAVEKKTVNGAFHNNAIILLEGRKAVAETIEQVAAQL